MRLRALVGLIALLTGSSVSPTAFLTGRQTERQGVVSVDVTVFDQKGSRASGLAREDFEVLVDGQARPIESATVDDRPVLVALLLDLSSSSPTQPPILKPAIEKRFWNSLGPSDRVRLGFVGVSPWGLSSSYGVERRALQSVLRLLDLPPTYTVQDKLVPTTSSVTPQIGVRERRATGVRMGPSPIWDAVYDATSALQKEPGSRTIILLADGRATGNVHGLDETITHALAAGISIHVVSAAEDNLIAVDASNAALVRPGVYLKTLADVTGGSFASLVDAVSASHPNETPSAEKISEQVGDLLTRVLRLAHAQYRLGFLVPTLDSSLHRLEVRVTRAGLTARSPARFIARGATLSR
jgi:VWFA-related protein